MEQQINVQEELERLENQIESIIDGATKTEAEYVEKEIRTLIKRVEEALIYEAGFPSGNVSERVKDLQKSLKDRLGKNLTSSRQAEYDETKANLSTVEKTELQDTSEGLARFQCQGISSKNNQYCSTVEEICEEVMRDYKRTLANIGTRGAQEAYGNIRAGIIRISGNLQEIHKDYSKRIKQDISKRIDEVGLKMTYALEQQIEQSVSDNLSKFERNMKSQTKSSDEVTSEDARYISKNEQAFISSSEPPTAGEKDFESLFK